MPLETLAATRYNPHRGERSRPLITPRPGVKE